jgi:hypothetical protein
MFPLPDSLGPLMGTRGWFGRRTNSKISLRIQESGARLRPGCCHRNPSLPFNSSSIQNEPAILVKIHKSINLSATERSCLASLHRANHCPPPELCVALKCVRTSIAVHVVSNTEGARAGYAFVAACCRQTATPARSAPSRQKPKCSLAQSLRASPESRSAAIGPRFALGLDLDRLDWSIDTFEQSK